MSHASYLYIPSRPKVIGVIAVLGIVVGVMSLLTSLILSACAAGLYLKSASSRDRFLLHAPSAFPISHEADRVALTTPLTTPVGRNGIDATERPAVLDAVSKRIEMSPEQVRQLDALLAADGLRIFSGSNDHPVVPDQVPDAMTRLGPLPAIGAESDEPFFFETAAGRVEVFAMRALFYPNKSVTPVRVTAGRRMNVSAHPILTTVDVEALIGLAQQSAVGLFSRGAKLNEGQLQSLRSILSDPNQQLVAVSPFSDGPAIGIQGVEQLQDGFTRIDFAGGPLLLSREGKVVLRSDRDSIPTISVWATVLVVGENVLSFALAIFSLVAAIRLLRTPRQNLRPMRKYAICKMGLAIFGGLVVGWFTHSLLTQAAASGHSLSDDLAWSFVAGGVILGVGTGWPITVLILSRNQRIKEYFEN